MAIKRMDHLGIVVRDIAKATAFFVALGLEVQGTGRVGGSLVDRIVAVPGSVSDIAMLQAPDGVRALELIQIVEPDVHEGDSQAPANTLGLRHVCFNVDDLEATVERLADHGGSLVGEIVDYEGSYLLCYLRGPEGIIIELAQDLG